MEQIILNVSQLNEYARRVLNQDPVLRNVRVRGEIGSFKIHFPSNHWYFSIKDETGKTDCLMFRSSAASVRFNPVVGDNVIITGYVDIYPPTGQFRMVASTMIRDGSGDLNARFEELKAKLYAEGLFDSTRKKQLPLLPRKIAVLTSESGAVWHDIRNVARLRNPSVPIMLIPVPVQGEGAAQKIAEAFTIAEKQNNVDVIIVGRGGGSAEDLWPFNEEVLARAVAACRIPVISAVGHETDFTICDMAADVRASTPSNAAEIAVPTCDELLMMTGRVRNELNASTDRMMRRLEANIASLRLRTERRDPEVRFRIMAEKTTSLSERYLALTEMLITERAALISALFDRIKNGILNKTDECEHGVCVLKARLENLSPANVLKRGYAMVTDRNGNIVAGAEDAVRTKRMNVIFSDGNAKVIIAEDEQ